MFVSSHRAGSPGHLEDLDVAALHYARKWTDADAHARTLLREHLICRCLPFVSRVAGRYRNRGEPVDDLEQVARVGLIKAVDRYDPGRGSFTAFAVVTMSGELKRHFRDRTWGMHVPRRLQDLTIEVRSATAVLTTSLARSPTVPELAGYLLVGEDEVREALTCTSGHSPTSLSTPVGKEGSVELGDLVGDTDAELETVADRLTVADLLGRLPTREGQILALRFYGNHSQAQIATELGISQMHVSRLLSRALTWLREAMLSDVPPHYDRADPVEHPTGILVRSGRHAGVVTVQIHGEVDRDCAERLRLGLRDAVTTAAGTDARVVVELSAMPLIDAAGMTVLLDAAAAGASAGVELALVAARPYVARLLDLAGLGPKLSADG